MAAVQHAPSASPARRSNLADRVYARLKAELFDFELMPGDPISENEIAERTQASRTPVREALFRLQRDGYVEVRERGGWYVKPLDFTAFDELYDVRITLECAAAARLCALDQRPPELAELAAVWQIERAARETDSTTLWQLDEQFHAGLLAAAALMLLRVETASLLFERFAKGSRIHEITVVSQGEPADPVLHGQGLDVHLGRLPRSGIADVSYRAVADQAIELVAVPEDIGDKSPALQTEESRAIAADNSSPLLPPMLQRVEP